VPHNGLVSSNHRKINHYAEVSRPEKKNKERKHDTWDTSSGLKYQILYIYDTSTIPKWQNFIYFLRALTSTR